VLVAREDLPEGFTSSFELRYQRFQEALFENWRYNKFREGNLCSDRGDGMKSGVLSSRQNKLLGKLIFHSQHPNER
jgi:hypothetical protein